MNISLSPPARENLGSRNGFDSPVPRQPAHLHTHAESGAYLGDSSRFPRRRPVIYLKRHTPSCRYCTFHAPFSSKFVSGRRTNKCEAYATSWRGDCFRKHVYYLHAGERSVKKLFFRIDMVTHRVIARVWINRVRLPIMLVVS